MEKKTEVIVEDSADESVRAARQDSQRPSATRSRAPAGLGGIRLKLAVYGEIPGYHLYFENDDGGAIEYLLSEGFEFVRSNEVSLTSHVVQDKDLDDRVSRYVGMKEDGTPMRAYLMKCTDEMWAERQESRLAWQESRDSEIRNEQENPVAGRYMPKGVTSALNPNFRKEY